MVIWMVKDVYDNFVISFMLEVLLLVGVVVVGFMVFGWINNGDGMWIVQIIFGFMVGELEVMLKLNGQDVVVNVVKVIVVVDVLFLNQLKVFVVEDYVKVGESIIVMFIVKDVYGNIISGFLLLVSLMGIVFEGVIVFSWIEKGDCFYVVMLIIGGKMGEFCVMLFFNGQLVVIEVVQLMVIVGEMLLVNFMFVVDNKVLIVKMMMEFIFIVKDVYGNLVIGLKLDVLVFSGVVSMGSECFLVGNWIEKGNGVYVVILMLGFVVGQLFVML